jgi:HAD superfamily hydrolase (TIGR01509 family)
MSPQARALLFDFGGTLDTDGVHWSEKYAEIYARVGVEVQKQLLDRAFVESDRALMSEAPLIGHGLGYIVERQVVGQLEWLAREAAGFSWDEGLAARLRDETLRDVALTLAQAREILASLAARHRLGVVSNFYGNLDRVLAEFDFGALVSVAVDSVSVGLSKPDPAIFRLAVERLGVPAAECIVVGDSYDRDIVPAKAAGCRTIWLKGRSWRTFEDTSQADAVITRLAELLRGPDAILSADPSARQAHSPKR